MSIPKTIINLREKQNMSQAELSKQMNLNKNIMSRIERGERPLRDNEILKLAQIFHVSTDLILDDQDVIAAQGESDYLEFLKKEEKDVAKQIECIVEQINSEEEITFYDTSITSKDRKFLTAILKMGLYLSKEEITKNS